MSDEPNLIHTSLRTAGNQIDASNPASSPEQRAGRASLKGVLHDTEAARRELALQNVPNFGVVR